MISIRWGTPFDRDQLGTSPGGKRPFGQPYRQGAGDRAGAAIMAAIIDEVRAAPLDPSSKASMLSISPAPMGAWSAPLPQAGRDKYIEPVFIRACATGAGRRQPGRPLRRHH